MNLKLYSITKSKRTADQLLLQVLKCNIQLNIFSSTGRLLPAYNFHEDGGKVWSNSESTNG